MSGAPQAQLADSWRVAWAQLDCPAPARALPDLLARYAEPHRAYHTAQHLAECFQLFAEVRDLAQQPGELALALFFHDAIWDPHAHDCEARSAALARACLCAAGAAASSSEAVATLILATRHAAEPSPGDATLLVDVDLAILGAAPARFREYEAQVRREYAWVAEPQFRLGRAAILRRFLDRPHLYGTPVVRDRLEAQARANLRESLARLTPV